MENKKVQVPLMNEEEFKEYVHDVANNKVQGSLNTKDDDIKLMTFEAVSKFKSVRRAIKRDHVSPYGIVYPKRPFNNRKVRNERGVLSRPLNERKKSIYEAFKSR